MLPHDEGVDFGVILDALRRVKFIESFRHDASEYGYIPGFKRHQVINNREKESELPEPPIKGLRKALDHEYLGRSVPDSVAQKVKDRDGNKCDICGKSEDLTIDHVIPQCVERNNSMRNLRVLCRRCNSGRPVCGEPLQTSILEWFDDLEIEEIRARVPGLLSRVPTREVHALVEGKGREIYISQKRKSRTFKNRDRDAANPECFWVFESHCRQRRTRRPRELPKLCSDSR